MSFVRFQVTNDHGMASILRGLVRIAETIAGVLDIGISARRTRLSRPANGQLVILAV